MRILIVDDEKNVAATLAAAVRGCNHEVVGIVSSGLDAIHSYQQNKPDVVLMDFLMSKLNGLTACRNILSSNPSAQIVLVSGMMPPENLANTGAIALLKKPLHIHELKELLDSLEHKAQQAFSPPVEPQTIHWSDASESLPDSEDSQDYQKKPPMFNRLSSFFSTDIGIDLGTANTLVYVRNQGIVLREPSVVAVHSGTDRVVSVGDDAKRMLGRTPGNITAIRPLKDGVIADFEITEAMLRHFIGKVKKWGKMAHPRVVIAVPSGITGVEKRAVKDSATNAGAHEVYLIEEPMAAAIGVGLPVQDAAGNMIIDIGGGTTEVALISLSGIVFSRSIRVAGDELDEAIVHYIKRAYNLMIGERTAEDIKIKIGSVYPLAEEMKMDVKGRDLVAGLPKTLTITSQEIREALLDPVASIVEAVRTTLEHCPPELSADLIDRGLVLAGGGALLRGLDSLLGEETGLPVHVADDPLSAIVQGTGKALDEIRFLRRLTTERQWQ